MRHRTIFTKVCPQYSHPPIRKLLEIFMSVNTEHFTSANKATADFLLSAANTALSSAERITALNLDTARSVLEDSVSNTKTLLGAKDIQEAIAIQANMAKPNIEKAAAYSNSVYEISTQTQQAFAQMIEVQLGDFQKSIAGLIEKAGKSAPAGSESVVAAMQSVFNAANSAFGNMNTTAKQFADAAKANITAATSAAAKVAGKKTVN